jgi:SAM-dependent methyltransferase
MNDEMHSAKSPPRRRQERLTMRHDCFQPMSFDEGRHHVVGDCNGFSMAERWEAETPAFAEAILRRARLAGPARKRGCRILDYGCGVGRLAKAMLTRSDSVRVTGVDASEAMLNQARNYVANSRFEAFSPETLHRFHDPRTFDIACCVYVLQHVPAVEIRDVLARIHYFMKEDGVFVHCSSDCRMAITFNRSGFFDDRFLGVDLQFEISRLFEPLGPLFNKNDLGGNYILKKMVTGCDGGLSHPALAYRKRKRRIGLEHGSIDVVLPK